MTALLMSCSPQETIPPYEYHTMVTELERRVGSDDLSAFGLIADLSVSQDGRLVYVLDMMSAEVTVWDSSGTFVRRVGGPGEGPGEFRDPIAVSSLDDGGFHVLDGERYIRFAPDGSVVGLHSAPASVSHRGFGLSPTGMTAEGAIIAHPLTAGSIVAGWYGDDPIQDYPLLLLTPGEPEWQIDTLVVVDDRNASLSVRRNDDAVGGVHMNQPFSDSDIATLDPEARTLAVTRRRGVGAGGLQLTKISASVAADTLWSRRIELAPVRLTPDSIQVFVEGVAEAIGAESWPDVTPEAVRRLIRESLFTPEHYPATDHVAHMSNGEVWMRSPEAADSDTLRVWYFVSGEEDPPTRVLLPEAYLPFDRRGDRVWGVSYDEFDVNYVERRRLLAPGGVSG